MEGVETLCMEIIRRSFAVSCDSVRLFTLLMLILTQNYNLTKQIYAFESFPRKQVTEIIINLSVLNKIPGSKSMRLLLH